MPRRSSRSGGKTRYEWTPAFGESVALAAGAAVAFLLGTATQSETVMRVRGELLLSLDGPADLDSTVAGWGIMVLPPGAVAGGVTAVPSTDGEADWLAYGRVPLRAEQLASGSDAQWWSRVMVDSKAMRRLREADELALVVENATLAGGVGMNVTFGLRILTGE